jgi:Family of unknown function (DUF6152)
MKRTLGVAVLAMSIAAIASAHHSGAAFDPNLKVEVSGTVSKVEWTSPHARLYVAAKDEKGAAVEWNFELPSPVTLMRRGWARTALEIGDVVMVTGNRAREYPHIAIATGVTDADGRRLFSGSASSAE